MSDPTPLLVTLIPDAHREILVLLEERGSATAEDVAEARGITVSGARQHLQHLCLAGAVQYTRDPDGPGRPTHVYGLTSRASEELRSLSPDDEGCWRCNGESWICPDELCQGWDEGPDQVEGPPCAGCNGDPTEPCYSCRPDTWNEDVRRMLAGPGPALGHVRAAIHALELDGERRGSDTPLSDVLEMLDGCQRVLEGVERG